MAATTSARRHLLGIALRQYREQLGYTMETAARLLDCDVSKISRIETGQRGIRSKELRELLEAYGVREDQQDILLAIQESMREITAAWWKSYTNVLSGAYFEYVVTEEHASHILAYEPLIVPALLQTQDYARAAALANPSLPTGAEEDAVEAVQLRHSAVLESRQTNLTVVIGEAALRQQVGSGGLMREQLRHLVELGNGTWRVAIRVLPFTAGVPTVGGCGSFSILRFEVAPALGMVHLDGPAGGVCLEDPMDVAAYTRAFTHVQVSALTPDASLRLIQDLARE